MLGSSLLIGQFLGSIFLMRLGDIFGRKYVVIISTLLGSVFMIGIIYSPNLNALYAFILLFGITLAPRNLSYVYCLELTTHQNQSTYSMICMLFDSLGMIILGIYFSFFKSMTNLIWFTIAVQTFAALIVLVFCPESPKFLYEKKEYDKFFQAIGQIEKFNRTNVNLQELKTLQIRHDMQQTSINNEDDSDYDSQTNSPETKQKKIHPKKQVSFINQIRRQKLLPNILILSLFWAVSSYSYYFIEFYMKFIPVNRIQTLSLMIGVSDVVCCVTFKFLQNKFEIRKLISVNYLLLLASSSVFYVIMLIYPVPSDAVQYIITLMIFGMRFFSAMTFIGAYQANNEYFPVLLKGGIFAITNVSARLSSIMSPWVAESMNNPAITVSVVAFIAFLASTILKKKDQDQDEIQSVHITLSKKGKKKSKKSDGDIEEKNTSNNNDNFEGKLRVRYPRDAPINKNLQKIIEETFIGKFSRKASDVCHYGWYNLMEYGTYKYRTYKTQRSLLVYGGFLASMWVGYMFCNLNKNLYTFGYYNYFIQSLDYSAYMMQTLGGDENQKNILQMENLLFSAFEKDGKLDTLDWLMVGQHFAKNMEEEIAFQAYQIAHLKDHQKIKTNSELQFETNQTVLQMKQAPNL
eukprot:403351837